MLCCALRVARMCWWCKVWLSVCNVASNTRHTIYTDTHTRTCTHTHTHTHIQHRHEGIRHGRESGLLVEVSYDHTAPSTTPVPDFRQRRYITHTHTHMHTRTSMHMYTLAHTSTATHTAMFSTPTLTPTPLGTSAEALASSLTGVHLIISVEAAEPHGGRHRHTHVCSPARTHTHSRRGTPTHKRDRTHTRSTTRIHRPCRCRVVPSFNRWNFNVT